VFKFGLMIEDGDMSLDIWIEQKEEVMVDVVDMNITHNLARMAKDAGIYDVVWNLKGITYAWQMEKPLHDAIKLLRSDPARFKKHNPKNGWGSYDSFIKDLEALLKGCREAPDGTVGVSR
jgi:hypothetical protein